MVELRRMRPYRVPVAIQMDFNAGLINPPAVHTLAKHYLDLLQQPDACFALRRNRILLQDDKLVKVLICNYRLSESGQQGIRIRVATMTDFITDLELFSWVIAGEFGAKRRYDHLHEAIHAYLEERDKQFDDSWEDYHDHVSHRREFIRTFGSTTYESLRLQLQRSVQEASLKGREPTPDQLASVYAPQLGKWQAPPFKFLVQASSQMIKKLYMSAVMSVELGRPASREGESEMFKQAVREALVALRKKRPIMYPLLTLAGVTILYIPPSVGPRIDLDNLARRVIPYVHEELRPPATLFTGLDVDRISNGEIKKNLKEMIERLKRAPKYHVTRYQVFELPSAEGDPKDGAVRLLVHGGLGDSGPWDLSDRILRAWERDTQDAMRNHF
jgi:hypothetical protein